MRYSEARQILAEAIEQLDILEGHSMNHPSFNNPKTGGSFNSDKQSISHPRPGTDPKSRLAMKKAAYIAALKAQRK